MGDHSPVSVTLRGKIALVQLDNPPVNALSQAVRASLLDAVSKIESDSAIAGAVLVCRGRTFIAGADIREFGKPPLEPFLPDVILAIEESKTPFLAAIHGTALGGGLEVALGCHYRIMTADAKVGLPEVTLGLLPGAGGTQRLPRLIGLERALEMITRGKPIPAETALAFGLIDQMVDADCTLEEAACDVLMAYLADGRDAIPTGARPVPSLSDDEAENVLKAIRRQACGQISPIKAAESVLNVRHMSLADGLAAERSMFLDLVNSDQASALRHTFFSKRVVGKHASLNGISARPLKSVAVIGAGTMGAGIAVAFERAGYSVCVVEQSPETCAKGRARIQGLYQALSKRGRLDASGAEAALASIAITDDMQQVADAGLVIEAVFEDMAVKVDLFQRLEDLVKPDAILATNTSYLDLDTLAAGIRDPSRCLGLHFFSPAHVMQLLEVVNGAKTAPDVLATGLDVAKRLGKTGVVAGVCDGFIGNRIWARYRQQLEYLLEDHAMPEEVDAALLQFGFPMGPFAVYDLSGLDIAWAQRKRRAETRDPQERYVEIPDLLCEAGRLGQKTGAGYYRYEANSRQPLTDPDVLALILEHRAGKSIKARPLSPDDIQRRARAVIVNEGAHILAEGIAKRPLDVDMVMIHGYGYPAWRGGPMHEADRIGLLQVLDDVQAMCAAGGYGWAPSDLLVELVRTGRSFDSLNG